VRSDLISDELFVDSYCVLRRDETADGGGHYAIRSLDFVCANECAFRDVDNSAMHPGESRSPREQSVRLPRSLSHENNE